MTAFDRLRTYRSSYRSESGVSRPRYLFMYPLPFDAGDSELLDAVGAADRNVGTRSSVVSSTCATIDTESPRNPAFCLAVSMDGPLAPGPGMFLVIRRGLGCLFTQELVAGVRCIFGHTMGKTLIMCIGKMFFQHGSSYPNPYRPYQPHCNHLPP